MPEKSGKSFFVTDNDSKQTVQYQKEWEALKAGRPIVLVVSLGNAIAETYVYTKPGDLVFNVDEHTVTFKENAYRRGGFSVCIAEVKRIIQNDSGYEIKEGDRITVKEDFYVYGDTLYTKNGLKPYPLSKDEEILVFASVVPEDTTTPLYAFNNDIRITLSTLPDQEPEYRSGTTDKKLSKEILQYYGIIKPEPLSVLPIVIGVGVAVCLVPTAVVLIVKKRRKATVKEAPMTAPTDPPTG